MVLLAVAIFLWWSDRVSEPVGLTLVVVACLVEIVEVWLWIRYLKRFRIRAGRESMLGEMVEVIRECDPDGTARYRGEIWSCRCEDGAKPGQRAVIAGLDGLTLLVSRADSDSTS